MRSLSPTKCGLGAAFLALSLGAGLATAEAQGSPYSNGPSESVIVVAPRLRVETAPLNGPMERASLSQRVRYDDLNLVTRSGARALRWRVWRTAQEVCDRLADAYPVYELSSAKPCLRTAYEDGMVRADEAINDARMSYRYGY